MSTVELWVEVFDATIDNWDKTGSTPYLDTQDMTNYVEDNDRNNDCGYFTFASSEDLGTINSVYLYIYAWAVEAADFEALINDASTGLNPPTSEGWVNAEITSIIGTWGGINVATLLLDRSNSKNLAGCDAAYILVNYTEPSGPTPGWNNLEYASGIPVSSAWNKLLFDPDPPSTGAFNKLKYK